MALSTLFGAACALPAKAAADLPKPAVNLPAAKDNADQTIVVAGGCFWCTEAVFETLKGVKDVVSGYTGGSADTANYKRVCDGDTGHAEAIKITYDPAKITYGELLRVFFTGHDPTTLNRQGADRGTQYRSAIFYENDEQKKVAEAYIKQLNDAKAFPGPVVTTVEPLKGFYLAEAYHQDFARKNPGHGYIQAVAMPKVQKVLEHFKDEVKTQQQEEKK
jgi:peptide-methionine (S)-S-oxide reductase